MRETGISYTTKDDHINIYTTDPGTAKSIKRRLEDRGADWEWAEYQNGDGSWKFKIPKSDCRAPSKVIKNPAP